VYFIDIFNPSPLNQDKRRKKIKGLLDNYFWKTTTTICYHKMETMRDTLENKNISSYI